MASSFSVKIANLRKRSRVLLSCLEENAKVVREEVKKLRSKDISTLRRLQKRRLIYGRNSDIWKLRNDSSGVGAALCPDYFRLSPKYESVSAPDMSAHRRLLVRTDKKHPKSSPQRKAIKECYCYTSAPETRKNNQRSARTKHSFKECQFATHREDGRPASAPGSDRINRIYEDRNNEEQVYSPPLSTATLRRAQKIDYTPRSKFLRKVQSKINSLGSSSPESTAPMTPRTHSSSPKRFNCELKYAEAGSSRREYPRRHDCQVDKEDSDTRDKIPKKTLPPKKTIVSKKASDQQKPDSKAHKHSESRSQGRRINLRSPPPIKRHAFSEKAENKYSRNYSGRDYERLRPCSEYRPGERWSHDEEPFDFEINNVRKFREKNYFDTHASNPSLLGSRSGSGSIEQFRLNERLFPEPMGRVHRADLVVSIPPCATRQKRSIHYFPRSVVKQEKNTRSKSCTRKRPRCPSCPLIGHAVDLGALKVSHPPNSLALRYQKGIP